jgi:hypothetical protein
VDYSGLAVLATLQGYRMEAVWRAEVQHEDWTQGFDLGSAKSLCGKERSDQAIE